MVDIITVYFLCTSMCHLVPSLCTVLHGARRWKLAKSEELQGVRG